MTDKKENTEDLPLITDVLNQLVRPGTLLIYPEKKIIFQNSQTAVKSLKVNICSTETNDMSALHKLNNQIRNS